MDRWTDGRMDGQMDGQMDGRTDGRTDRPTKRGEESRNMRLKTRPDRWEDSHERLGRNSNAKTARSSKM